MTVDSGSDSCRWQAWLERYGDDYATDDERAAAYRDYRANLALLTAIMVDLRPNRRNQGDHIMAETQLANWPITYTDWPDGTRQANLQVMAMSSGQICVTSWDLVGDLGNLDAEDAEALSKALAAAVDTCRQLRQ